jgi:septal ring factor EnvC (AmiA/AmiB activator)
VTEAAAHRRIALAALAPALAVGLACVALAAPGAREKLKSLNARETTLNAQQGRNINDLARLLSVLVQMRRDPPPALLVSPQDAKNAVRAAILVKAMTPELQRRARAYAIEGAEIARQRRLAAVASAALFTSDSEDADHRLEGDLLDLSGGALRGAVTPDRPAPAFLGPVTAPIALLAPTPGPLAHRFGEPLTGGGKANGLTITAPSAAVVRSPGDGLVQYAGPVKGWGVILILRLSGGYHLVLAGLDRSSVDVGQSVAAGAPVGWMPDGRQSPTELYLEVRERGAPVDPGRWMRPNAG